MISPELRQRFETLRQNIVTSGTSDTFEINKAEVKLIKDQHSEARVRGFNVIQDGPERYRRNRQGPNSNRLFHRVDRLLRERDIRPER